MKVQNWLFWGVLLGVAAMVSCTDPIADDAEKERKRVADSLAQAEIDQDLIEDYWTAKGYDDGDLYPFDSITSSGVRCVILEDAGGDKPEFNQIVSVHYIGQFLNDSVFDTSVDTLAVYLDSMAWIEKWKDYTYFENDFTLDTLYVGEIANDDEVLVPEDTLDVTGYTVKEKLTSLRLSSDPLDQNFYLASRSYDPIAYNYIFDGSGISGYISGFEEGLHILTPHLSIGSRGLIVIPSAVAYGTIGAGTIDPNTVIAFEFISENIRP